MSIFGRFTIRARLLSAFALVGFLLSTAALYGCLTIVEFRQSQRDVQSLSAIRDLATTVKYYNADIPGWQYTYVEQSFISGPVAATDDAGAFRPGLLKDRKELNAVLEKFSTVDLTAHEKDLVTQIDAVWQDFWVQDDAVVAAVRRGDVKTFDAILNGPAWEAYDKILALTGELQESVDGRLAATRAAADAAANRGQVVALSLLGVALVLGIVLALRVTHGVRAPLARLVAALDALAQRDLTHEVSVEGRDEVAQLARAYTSAVQNMHDAVDLIAGSADALDRAAVELSRCSAESVTTSQTTRQHAHEIASSVDDVGRAVATVSEGSDAVGAAIAGMARSSTDAAEVASEAVGAAAKTKDLMTRLDASSQTIGEVVEVITNIAEQTNLLALNATIEAARAGEYGKGFAVVASEVKDLAHETGEATERITGRVSEIRSETTQAVSTIDAITDVIARINAYQEQIAAALEEQATTTSQVSDAIAAVMRSQDAISSSVAVVAESADRTSESIQTVNEVSEQISTQSGDLRSAVASFKR